MSFLKCDVLVAGGGIAGIAAALAAARNGADVILVEKQCCLGGLATSGLVTIYLPLCDGKGTQISYGIAEELFRLSIRHGIQDKDPGPWLQKDSTRDERAKIRFETQFNPVYFMLEAEALLLREHVRILYDTRICGAVTENDTITAVETENEDGRGRIECRAAVDATGSAVLERYAGEQTEKHAIGNAVAGWYYASSKQGLKLKMLGFADIAEGSERDGIRAGSGIRFAGDTAEDVNQYLYLSHRSTLNDLGNRSKTDLDFLEPALMTSMPQFRMIRRLISKADMTEADDGKSFEDSIGMVSDWRKRGPRYEVPYGCLFGNITNLYAAGRITGCDDGMWDIMRVIPCCAVTGEAAGTAAALTGDERKRVPVTQVQNALVKAGQRLHLNELD